MATRGAFGFRLDGRDKVSYNHYNSYPECLGRAVVEFIAQTPDESLLSVARHVTLVNSKNIPSAEQRAYYAPLVDPKTTDGTLTDWRSLLEAADGQPSAYTVGVSETRSWNHRRAEYVSSPVASPVVVRHILDAAYFLADSLFCEWAYLINLDDRTLEVYRGLNQDPAAPGRYAALTRPGEEEYFGVRLLLTLPLGLVRMLTADAAVGRMMSAADLLKAPHARESA